MAVQADEWVGAPRAAELLGIRLPTLYRRIDAGELPAFRFGRVIRLRRCDIDAFVERCRVQPGTIGSAADVRDMGE